MRAARASRPRSTRVKSATNGHRATERAATKAADPIGGLKALLLIATLGLLFIVASLGSVRADAETLLWRVGDALMAYPGSPHEAPRHLELNGARISFRAHTVDSALSEVLDYYETLCEIGQVRAPGQRSELGTDDLLWAHEAGALRAIATRANRNLNSGYVSCLGFGSKGVGLAALSERFRRFAITGNLAELGEMRHVFARRVDDHAGDKTLLLTIWTESELNLYRLLPLEGGDAAGRDAGDVPRPPKSQRVLSAWESDRPSGVVVYRVPPGGEEPLESFYQRELHARGWRLIEPQRARFVRIDDVRMLSAERNGRLVTVLVNLVENSASLVTILTSEPT